MIRLDYRDARPIYEQVKDGLRRLMVTGVLAPGEKLPSVRSLAMDLAINPNTVAGRGTFVAEGQEQNLVRRREVEAKVQPLVQELRELGMTEGEWIALWRGGNENA